MQNVVWKAVYKDGFSILEDADPDHAENFTNLSREGLMYFCLEVKPTGATVGINLENGEFLIGGFPVRPSKEISGSLITISGRKLDYAKGLIQYKCAKPMAPKPGASERAQPLAFVIGYKVDIPSGEFRWEDGKNLCELTHFQPMVSINADTYTVSMSVTSTVRRLEERFIRV